MPSYIDNLNDIKRTCFLWYRSRFLVRMTYFTFVSMVFYLLLLFYEVYSCGIDLKFLLSYGANIFSNIYYILTSTIYILQGKQMRKMDRYIEKQFLRYSAAGNITNVAILKRSLYGKYLAYFLICVAVMDTASLLPIGSDKSGLLYVIMMMKKYRINKSLQLIHAVLYYVIHFFVFKLCWSYINMILYFVLHVNIQFMLLLECLNNINVAQDNSGHNNQHIREKLSFIIRHYQKISRYQTLLEQLLRVSLYFVVWLGLFAFIFVSYMLTNTDLDFNYELTLFVVWITIALIAVSVISFCQFYADQNEEFWNALCQCQWYEWAHNTQKSYRILLGYAGRDRAVTAGVIRIDFSFVIWFGRKTASAVAFLTTIEERNSRK